MTDTGNHAQSVETNYEQHGPSKWVRYVDFLAATSLGQFFIRATLRLLHVVVNIIWWTCPRTEGGPPEWQLVRPFSWVIFLPLLLWLRIGYFGLCFACHVIQLQRPRPVNWVRNLRKLERQVRYLKITGRRTIDMTGEPRLVEGVVATLNMAVLDWFGLEMKVKDDWKINQQQRAITEAAHNQSTTEPKAKRRKPQTHFPKSRPDENDQTEYVNLLLNLSMQDHFQEHPLRPSSESESTSDGTYTVSSSSSSEDEEIAPSTTSSISNEQLDTKFPAEVRNDLASFVKHLNSLEEAEIPHLREEKISYPSDNSSGFSSMERSEVIAQELFDAIATVEGYSESNDKDGDSDKSQHTLDDVQNLPEEEEASSSEIPYQYSNSPKPRRQSILLEGTPSTPTITFSQYDEDSDDVPPSTSETPTSRPNLSNKNNATTNDHPPSVTTTPLSSTVEPSADAGDLPATNAAAISRNKRRRMKKNQKMQQHLDNK